MKIRFLLVVIAVFTVVVAWLLHVMVNGHKGVVMVEGYAYAVVLCEGEQAQRECARLRKQ